MSIENIAVWAHILCMLGAFGGLLIIQIGLPRDARESASVAAVAGRPAVKLLVVGLLVGLFLYWNRIKHAAAMDVKLPSAEHMIIGIKFLLLLSAGAFMGATAKALRKGDPGKASNCRWLAILALAIAALFGVRIS